MQNQHNQGFNKAKGFSLLEMLIAVGVLGLIIVIVGPKMTTIFSSFNSYGAQSEIELINSAVKSLRPNGDFSGDLVTPLTQNDSLPNNMVNGATLQNQFNQPITLAATNINGGTNNGYLLTYPLTKAECAKFVSNNWRTYIQVDVNGTTVTAANADTACNVDGINQLVLTAQ